MAHHPEPLPLPDAPHRLAVTYRENGGSGLAPMPRPALTWWQRLLVALTSPRALVRAVVSRVHRRPMV